MKEYSAMELGRFCNYAISTLLADKDYFASHTDTSQDLAAKKQLRETVFKFSREQLCDFMAFVIRAKRECFLFMSFEGSAAMFADLNEACRKKDGNVPSIYGDKYKEFVQSNPAYYHNYLSKKTIAQIFCDHIDKHINLAAKAAKVFYRSGPYVARDMVVSELDRY